MFKNTKQFYKYFLSYLIIFFIPYLTISAIFYNISVSDLRNEIIRTNTVSLEQVSEFTDSRMKELGNIATRISVDERLTPYLLKKPYNRIEAIEQLLSYKVNSSIIENLYLYYHGEDIIYSSNGTSTIPNFFNGIVQTGDPDFTKNDILASTDKLKNPTVLPMEIKLNNRSENVISYIYPISPYNAYSYGSAIFYVTEGALTKLIENVLGDFEGNIYIFNERDQLLTSSSNGIVLDVDLVKDLALDSTGVKDEMLHGERFSLVTVHSDISNWTFVTAMPTDQFYNNLSNLKSSIFIILSIIALIGIGTSIFISFKQYRPIQKLAYFIKNKQVEYDPSKNKNIIDNIRETIETIYNDSEQLQKRVKEHQPLIRDHFLLKLLRGRSSHMEDMENKDFISDLKITFQGNSFFVVVVSFKDSVFEQDSLKTNEDILNLLRNLSFKNSTGYGVELIHDNLVGLIVNMKEKLDSPSDNRRIFVNFLIERLQGYNKFISGIGVGEIYSGIDSINRSFIESSTALEFNHLKYNNEAIYFEDILKHHQGQKFWYPNDKQNQAKLIQSLKQGDEIVAKETLKTIIYHLKAKDISTHILKCMSFDIINCVLESVAEIEANPSVDNIKSLIEFQSLGDLEERINILIEDTCDEIQNRKDSKNIILRDNILDYIKTNYKSHHLSLESIAEVFQLSTSYLSRFIREQTGETYTQYLWNLRIRECKRQLLETDLPIKSIVIDIGYIDTANFTRGFKNTVGLTPGQYRKSHSLPREIKDQKLF